MCISHIGGEAGYQSPTSKHAPHLRLPTNFLSHKFLRSFSYMIALISPPQPSLGGPQSTWTIDLYLLVALMSPTSAKSRWPLVLRGDCSLSVYSPPVPHLSQVQVALSPQERLIFLGQLLARFPISFLSPTSAKSRWPSVHKNDWSFSTNC